MGQKCIDFKQTTYHNDPDPQTGRIAQNISVQKKISLFVRFFLLFFSRCHHLPLRLLLLLLLLLFLLLLFWLFAAEVTAH
jgi:Ca2+/Na+ antiporter